MYLQDYIWFLVALIACALLSAYASNKVNKTFREFNGIRNLSGTTGYDTAYRLLKLNGINDIQIGLVKGTLSDHYHPKNAVVNLSESTYSRCSIGAVAVASHEIGHVMQNKTGYFFYKVRTALVPIANFGSMLSIPLVLLGIIIDFVITTTPSNIGFYVALVGVALYGGSFLFALITLPVELNASKRAKQMLLSSGILTAGEVEGAERVLNAAALTYVASLLTNLVYFLRFLIKILTIFGRRNNR